MMNLACFRKSIYIIQGKLELKYILRWKKVVIYLRSPRSYKIEATPILSHNLKHCCIPPNLFTLTLTDVSFVELPRDARDASSYLTRIGLHFSSWSQRKTCRVLTKSMQCCRNCSKWAQMSLKVKTSTSLTATSELRLLSTTPLHYVIYADDVHRMCSGY